VAKLSVKLTKQLAEKVEQWKGYGLRPSDTVRLALSLLPRSPEEIQNQHNPSLLRIRSMPNQNLRIELKDEKAALKMLQE
jgi:Arc/MetJ-type ribon-helix-helix transcriptional regulator